MRGALVDLTKRVMCRIGKAVERILSSCEYAKRVKQLKERKYMKVRECVCRSTACASMPG